MPRLILLLPTSTYRARDFVAAAREIDADLVIASDRHQALGDVMGNTPLVVDFDDPKSAGIAVAEGARDGPVDAVVAVDDESVAVAAEAASLLGLSGHSPTAVGRARDKIEMRRTLAESDIPQPRFEIGQTAPDELPLPCVVKPPGLSASRGVIRADTRSEAVAAAARIRRILSRTRFHADGPLLFEEFLDGPEVAVEAIMSAGRLKTLAVFDKPDPLDGPYFEETIYVTPARVATETLRAVEDTTAQAAKALGLVDGPIHAELRLTESGPAVIEIAARSIGGLCSRTLRFGAGISLEEVILRHALGMSFDDVARSGSASGVMMLPIPRAGTLAGIDGRDAALAVDGVDGLEITIAEGRPVTPLPEGDRYLGFLFARAETPDAVEASLRAGYAALDIRII